MTNHRFVMLLPAYHTEMMLCRTEAVGRWQSHIEQILPIVAMHRHPWCSVVWGGAAPWFIRRLNRRAMAIIRGGTRPACPTRRHQKQPSRLMSPAGSSRGSTTWRSHAGVDSSTKRTRSDRAKGPQNFMATRTSGRHGEADQRQAERVIEVGSERMQQASEASAACAHDSCRIHRGSDLHRRRRAASPPSARRPPTLPSGSRPISGVT
jgi:hypothetical protein